MHLKIHKALLCKDVTIEIKLRDLPMPAKAESIYKAEGKSIAQALWDSLPGNTVDAIMAELNRLEGEAKNEQQ